MPNVQQTQPQKLAGIALRVLEKEAAERNRIPRSIAENVQGVLKQKAAVVEKTATDNRRIRELLGKIRTA